MKAHEFWRWCDSQMPDHPHAEVMVIDEEGFRHVIKTLYWDAEQVRWIISTRFQTDSEVTQDGPGYPAQ